MAGETQVISSQADQAYLITQGESGNTPVTNEFWSGYSIPPQMVATIISFDIPEELTGKEIIDFRLYLFATSSGWYTELLNRGQYAPISTKSWDDLNMPPSWDAYTPDEEMWGNVGSVENISDSGGWRNGAFHISSANDLKSCLNGLVCYGPNFRVIGSDGEPFNHYSFTQKPYFNIEIQPVRMIATDGYPNGGYVDKSSNLTLTWSYEPYSASSDRIFDRLPQVTSAYLILKNTSQNTSKQYTLESPFTSIVIPSSDLSDGNYQWTVYPTFDCEGYVSGDITFTFTTLAEIPVAVIQSPSNEIVNGNRPVTFLWKYLSGSGSIQAKWEIEVSSNGTQWSDLTSEESSASNYTAPAGSLPTGRVYWRVQVTDTAGNVSEWSDPAQIVVQAQVATPTITLVLNQARPVVQWTSSGQISYELQIYKNGILVYSTGETPGSATAHQVTDYLSPGSYVARLRIRDSALEQSDWATSNFTLSFSTTLTPSLTAQSVTNGVQLTPSGMGTVNYLLRDGVPIAKITGPYTDYSASAGERSYILRAVDASDNFTDSAAVVGTTIIRRGALLSPVTDLSQSLELWLRRGENPTRSMTSQATTTAHHAAGREFPVVDYYEFSDNELSLSFSFCSAASWEALRALLGQRQTMLYRDSHGEKLYLVVPSSSWERGRFSVDFDLSALQVDYVEAINYDPPGVVT